MRFNKLFAGAGVALVLTLCLAVGAPHVGTFAQTAQTARTADVAVGPQYDTTVGTVSVFGFKTPIPFPFGLKRTGYLVTDMDEAVRAAKATGADVFVAPFNDPIGQDAIIQ